MASPLEINMEIEIKEPFHASLFLSKANPIFGLKPKKFLKVTISFFKKDKSKIYLQFQKTSTENDIHLGVKDKMIKIELPIQEKMKNPTEIPDKKKDLQYSSIKLSFLIEKNEIKILHSKDVVFSEFIDTEKLFGNYVYILLESSKNIKKENFKEFSICYLNSSPKSLRNLQESTSTQLEYIEVDEYSIKTSPNILKEGNTMIIPTVKLNPKDKNGNFPSDILSFTRKDLKNLFNLTHSKNGTIFYQVAILSKKELIINIATEIPGEISISSKYFKNDITYILPINETELDIDETLVEIDEQNLISGINSTIKIIPRSKYQTPIAFVDESNIEKFEVTITLPNKTVINAEKGKFDPEEKAIIFNPKLNFKGEAYIEIKYGDIIMPCKNCNISVRDIDWQQTKIVFSETINLGEISNLTIYPKDENGNELSPEKILEKIEFKCTFGNNSLEIISEVNQDNIKIFNKEIVTHPGNLTWEIICDDKIIVYQVIIIGEADLSKFKMNIYGNSTNEEIRDNNTKITLDIKSEFIITYELVDFFYNKLEDIDSANITEVQMLGNDMIPINFDIKREGNIFNFTLSENNKKEFNDLVSGDDYELMIKIEKDDKIIYYHFSVTLRTSEDDSGYGNGPYNISHFTFEPNIDKYELFAGETFKFYLNVRTQQDLLYHKDLDINEHLKFNQTFEDETFSFKASNIDSQLGIFLIELYSTKAFDNEIELEMTFDGQRIEKKIMFIVQGANIPNPNYTEIINYTSLIADDIQPIIIYLKIKDDYLNYIYRKDIVYKRQLFIMNQNEKPEQNIEMDNDNKTYILYYVSDYHNSSLNLSIYFNNSNELILMKSNIIVHSNVENFLEDEDLVTETAYTPGVAFLYTSLKYVNVTFEIDDEETDEQNQDVQVDCDFILYIKDIHYEKSENNTKLELYTGYLAILQLTNTNSSMNEGMHLIYDKKLIDIYEQLRNNSDNHIYIEKNDTWNDSSGFIKLEFYENGEIKKIYYPKIDTFTFKSMDYIKEIIDLTIPKISPHLFSEDIHSKFNEIQEDLLEVDTIEEKRNILLRRLKESQSKKRKKNTNKPKKIRFRVLQENLNDTTGETNETFVENEIIPFEDEIDDYELREIKENGDNTSNITLLSIGDIESDYAKITGSLDNKTVLTQMDDDGKVLSIYQNQKSIFVTGVRDPELDYYIFNKTYNENSYFKKETFLAENETDIINEENPIRLKKMNINNHNFIIFLDEFSDDHGKLTEYFNNTIYEEYNETLSTNYAFEEMGSDYLDNINGSNVSISIMEVKEENSNNLRNLDSNVYPFYGEKIVNNVKDVYEKHFLGITLRNYIETSIYPDSGITLVETIFIFGNIKNTLYSQKSYSNNHIIIKNKNTMSNEVVNFIDELIKQISNETSKIEDEYSNIHNFLSKDKPYINTYDTLIDGYATQFEVNTNALNKQSSKYLKYINRADIDASNSILKLENTIKSECEKIKKNHLNKLNAYYNLNRDFNKKVLDLVKNEYEKENSNVSIEIIHEITDDIGILNDYIEDNITQYLLYYNDNLSLFTQFENISLINVLTNLKDQYNSKIETFLNILEYINFSTSYLNLVKDQILNDYRQSVVYRYGHLLDRIKLLKENRIYYRIKSTRYRDFSNKLLNYLKLEELGLDLKVRFLKQYLEPIYTSLHNCLFNFYKEFSKEVFYTLNNIESDNYTSSKEILFEIIINITNEYKNIVKSSSNDVIDKHKKEIDKYLIYYRETTLKYLYNIKVNELIQNYKPSNEFWNTFNGSLNEIRNSFESNKNYDRFLQYPEELDCIIQTLILFKDEIPEISEVINNYSKKVIISNIDIIYENTLEYILKFVDLNKNYLISNIDKIDNLSNYINITAEKLRIKEYFLTESDIYNNYSSFKSFTDGDLKNFTFINEDIVNNFTSTIQNTISAINKSRDLIYNCYHGINNEGNECGSTDEIINENVNNRFMRTRLELLISYMNLFAEKLNETYDENDYNSILNNGTNMEEIMESYYISELNKSAYDLIETDLNNLYDQIDKDIYFIKDTYNDVNYTDLIFEYENILNNTDLLFLNITVNKYYKLNRTIYSLIEQYEEILYQFIDDYNYTIISFDLFNNYFNSFLKNITDKYESVKTKINIFKGTEVDKEINRSDINRFFRENLTALMNKRNNSFIELLKNNDVEYKILHKDFLLSEYILKQVSENDTNNLNYINNKTNIDCIKFVNTIEELISDFDYPIKVLFKNKTDEFLIQFKNGDNLTKEERDDITKAYENEFFLLKNDTYRKCWNLRGKYEAEVLNEDKINYNNYLDYINKIQIIEECEKNGAYDCAYSREDLEEVVYSNETELYQFCNEIKKIYGHKQSIFYSMEDFDLDGLNKINEKFLNVLNELYSFDHLLTDYIYDRFGLSIYESVDNKTINIEETATLIMDTVNTTVNDINEKYDNYVCSQLTSKLEDIYSFYYYMTYTKTNSTFSLFTNMKNRFFVNYYFQKYQIFENLFKELLRNMTIINPGFKNTLIDVFPEIEEDQNKFSSHIWIEDIEDQVFNYYSDTFPNLFINSYFDFIKDKINKNDNITILKDNIDDIINETKSSSEFSNVQSYIIESLSVFRMIGLGSNNTFGEYTEKKINNSVIEQIVEEITTTTESQEKPKLLYDYEEMRNTYLNQLDIKYEGFDVEKLVMPLLNNSVYQSFQLDDELDELIEELKQTSESSFDPKKVPDFFSIAYNESFDYYKEVFNKTKDFYRNIIQIINNTTLFDNTDIIDDKFGNISGYGIIEGLYYLDPVCDENGCPYRIDFLKYKEEVKNNPNRRLSEKPVRDGIKEVMKLLKEMRDINKNNSYYIFENMTNSKRKLSTKYDYEIYENYDSHSPSRDKKQVEVIISYLKSAIDELNEKFYYYAKSIQTEIKNTFADDLKDLEGKYLKYLSIFERIFPPKDYRPIESILTNLMYKLNFYVDNTTDSIYSLAEKYLDRINNIYFSQKIAGDVVSHKLTMYYDGLDLLIQSKYKNFKEDEYKAAYKAEQKEFMLQNQHQLVTKLMLQTLKAETEIETEIDTESKKIFDWLEDGDDPDIMDENLNDYSWEKSDNYNEEKDADDKYNFMMRKKQEKKEDEKEEAEKEEKKEQIKTRGDKIKDTMKEYFRAEAEIKLNWTSLLESSIQLNVGFEVANDIHTGIQYPFVIPACPIVQIRLGIKISLYYRIYFGFRVKFQYSKEEGEANFDLDAIFEFSVGFKIDAVAEGGIYAGIVSAYGGVSGTILDVKASLKVYLLLLDGQLDFYTNLSINAIQIRFYVEVEAGVWFFKTKVVLLEKSFGLTAPLLNMYYYVKFNKEGQVIYHKKDIDSIFKD